ncbi:MAG: GNAT family N-acetyltransferase [Methanobacteriaceae archaeon]|nr:GNAT family N-acetyltransferase [Methanobacteriaceae archaeon]
MECNEIISLKDNPEYINKTKLFLMKMIKEEYGYGYIKEYHSDIKNLKETYLIPKNNFYIILNKTKDVIGSIGIRGYDKNFKEFKHRYTKENTSSVWRMFIDKKYRRKGLGSQLVKMVERFSKEENYNEIYLHTHKNVEGALNFWKSLNYRITIDTNNELKTIHMEKKIIQINLENNYNNMGIKNNLAL